jgi:hypothetical protein
MGILFVEEDANADVGWMGTPSVAAIMYDVEKSKECGRGYLEG